MWEYRIVEYSKMTQPQLADAFNAQGQDGWELFHIEKPFYYFKRPKAGANRSNVDTWRKFGAAS